MYTGSLAYMYIPIPTSVER